MQPITSRKLLDQVRDVLRLKHYSFRTEQAYVDWVRRFILFHHKRHPAEMGAPEIEAFLTHLAVDENVAASTQNQALCALEFLYREVLHREWDDSIAPVRAKKPRRLPTVLTKDEARRVIGLMSGVHQLMAKLLYGSGLRLMECVRLRASFGAAGMAQANPRHPTRSAAGCFSHRWDRRCRSLALDWLLCTAKSSLFWSLPPQDSTRS